MAATMVREVPMSGRTKWLGGGLEDAVTRVAVVWKAEAGAAPAGLAGVRDAESGNRGSN